MTALLVPMGASTAEVLHDVARKLRASRGSLALISPDLVIARAALAPIVDDPFAGTALLVQSKSEAGDVRVRHHVVNSVGSSHHRVTAPGHQFVGALVVAAGDAQLVAAAVEAMAGAADRGALVDLNQSDVGQRGLDVVQLVAVAIVRSGVTCRAIELVDVPWFRNPADIEAAERAVQTVSDARIAQLQANRLDDGFYSTFVVRKLSKPLTRLAIRLGLSPNLITVISLIAGLGAAACFAMGYRWPVVIGALLLQLSLVIDCVDGEVARATGKYSALGAWLDASTDRVKEYLAYAGLAAGAMVLGTDMWPVALILMIVQTTRHMTDYDFSRVQRLREARVEPRDVADPDDGATGGAGGWSVSTAMELSTRLNRRSAIRWTKRAMHLPIGERWLIISVAAALLGPGPALLVLLAGVLMAFGYVTVGRVLRTTTWFGSAPAPAGLLLARQFDGGPVASLVARIVPVSTRERIWSAPPAWAIPATLRLVELGLVAALAVGWQQGAVVVAFWWVAVVTFHHYDVLYRALQDYPMPTWLTWLGLGWEGRTIIVIIAFSLGASIFSSTIAIGAGVGALLFVVIASIQWLMTQRRDTSTGKDGNS